MYKEGGTYTPSWIQTFRKKQKLQNEQTEFDFRGNPATSGKVFYFDGSSVFRKTN